MFYTQLEVNSPKNRFRQITQQASEPFYHLTLKKLSKLEIYYDDIVINKKRVAKVIFVAKIVQFQKATSPRGMAIIKIKIQDTTGCTELFYYFTQLLLQKITNAFQKQLYLKLAVQIKVGGLVYRPQIQFAGISLRVVQDFNQMTLHFLGCLKSQTLLYK